MTEEDYGPDGLSESDDEYAEFDGDSQEEPSIE
jgi:hypothetical protein